MTLEDFYAEMDRPATKEELEEMEVRRQCGILVYDFEKDRFALLDPTEVDEK